MRKILSAMVLVAGLAGWTGHVEAQRAPTPDLNLDDWSTMGVRYWEFQGCTIGFASCHTLQMEAGVFRENANPQNWWYAWRWQTTHEFNQAGTLGALELEYRPGGYAPHIPNDFDIIGPNVCTNPLSPCLGTFLDTDMTWKGNVVSSLDYFVVTSDNTRPIALELEVWFGDQPQIVKMGMVDRTIVAEPAPLLLLIVGGLLLATHSRLRHRADRVA